MSNMTGYKLVYANDPQHLEKEVGQYLKEGWEPLGAPFVMVIIRPSERHRETITFYQAMTHA